SPPRTRRDRHEDATCLRQAPSDPSEAPPLIGGSQRASQADGRMGVQDACFSTPGTVPTYAVLRPVPPSAPADPLAAGCTCHPPAGNTAHLGRTPGARPPLAAVSAPDLGPTLPDGFRWRSEAMPA